MTSALQGEADLAVHGSCDSTSRRRGARHFQVTARVSFLPKKKAA